MDKQIQMGTVSHGTMRNEDLIPSFAAELAYYTGDEEWAILFGEIEDMETSDNYDWDSDRAQEVLFELFDALDGLSPAYCYFGENEGDGSDYGFWICRDSIEEDCHYGELAKVSDMSESGADTGMVLHVNDHGNCSLYCDGKEVWSIV